MARSVSQEEEEMEMTLMGIGWLYLNGKDPTTERVVSFHFGSLSSSFINATIVRCHLSPLSSQSLSLPSLSFSLSDPQADGILNLIRHRTRACHRRKNARLAD